MEVETDSTGRCSGSFRFRVQIIEEKMSLEIFLMKITKKLDRKIKFGKVKTLIIWQPSVNISKDTP